WKPSCWARTRTSELRSPGTAVRGLFSLRPWFLPMGLDTTIRFPGGETPTWEAIHAHLSHAGEQVVVRMIDGMPAFPEEIPEPTWRELRVGTSAGMVTIRRTEDALTCVIWGNADEALTAAWNRVIWACAEAGVGLVESPSGSLSAAEFARSAGVKA